jgi:hypothetical protein
LAVSGGVRHAAFRGGRPGPARLRAVEDGPREPRRAVKQRVPLTRARRGVYRLKQLPDNAVGETLLEGQTARG